MPQHIGAVTLLVPDYDAAISYFCGVLGFELVEDRPLADGKRWVLVRPRGAAGTAVLLARAASEEQSQRIGGQAGGRVFLFLETDDFEAIMPATLRRAWSSPRSRETRRTERSQSSRTGSGTAGI